MNLISRDAEIGDPALKPVQGLSGHGSA